MAAEILASDPGDPRVKVRYDGPVWLPQLRNELGYIDVDGGDAAAMQAGGQWVIYKEAIPGTLSASALAAALNAHVPNSPAVNAATIRARGAAALTTNATFLANASPTNADMVAETRALARQNNGVIRLLLGLLDTTVGT